MKFNHRRDREILLRLQKQKKYKPRDGKREVSAAMTRIFEKLYRGAKRTSDFGSAEDLINPVEDTYYVSSHYVSRDIATEMSGFQGAAPPKQMLLAALGILLLVYLWRNR